MPDVKVYVRQENVEKWQSIHNKSEWLNTLLANSGDTSNYGREIDMAVGEMVTVLSEDLDEFNQFKKDYSLPGVRPPHPIYGYPCCHKEIPCKHWHHRELEGDWDNELTKETKEAWC